MTRFSWGTCALGRVGLAPRGTGRTNSAWESSRFESGGRGEGVGVGDCGLLLPRVYGEGMGIPVYVNSSPLCCARISSFLIVSWVAFGSRTRLDAISFVMRVCAGCPPPPLRAHAPGFSGSVIICIRHKYRTPRALFCVHRLLLRHAEAGQTKNPHVAAILRALCSLSLSPCFFLIVLNARITNSIVAAAPQQHAIVI